MNTISIHKKNNYFFIYFSGNVSGKLKNFIFSPQKDLHGVPGVHLYN